MADPVVVPPVTGDTTTTTTVQSTPTPKFAGKFTDESALATGINALRDKLGYEPLAKPIGEDGTFKTPEEAVTEYKALERLQGAKKKAVVAPTTPADPLKIGETPAGEVDADVPTILTKAGLQQADLEKQWTEKGDLSPEQYDAIRKARPSLTKADIKLIAQGMAATAAVKNQAMHTAVSEAANVVGGTTQLENLIKSAATLVTPAEKEDFNRRLANPALMAGAVRDLAARHAQAVGAGQAQPLVAGGTPTGPSLPKSATEWSKLVERAAGGDQAAYSMLMATPQEHIDGWKVKVGS